MLFCRGRRERLSLYFLYLMPVYSFLEHTLYSAAQHSTHMLKKVKPAECHLGKNAVDFKLLKRFLLKENGQPNRMSLAGSRFYPVFGMCWNEYGFPSI